MAASLRNQLPLRRLYTQTLVATTAAALLITQGPSLELMGIVGANGTFVTHSRAGRHLLPMPPAYLEVWLQLASKGQHTTLYQKLAPMLIKEY